MGCFSFAINSSDRQLSDLSDEQAGTSLPWLRRLQELEPIAEWVVDEVARLPGQRVIGNQRDARSA